MPRGVRKHRKDANHAEIVKQLHDIPNCSFVLDTAQNGESLDLVVCISGVIALVEIKNPEYATKANRENPATMLTPDESAMSKKIIEDGGCYIIAFFVDDIVRGVEQWRRDWMRR